DGAFEHLSPSRSGSYKITFNTIRTAFDRTNSDIESNVFKQFEDNLNTIKTRFRTLNNAEFDSASQDVVIPAFLAAYSGANAQTISLSPFPNTPLPNWRVDYNGLSKIPAFQDIFQSVT